MSIPTFALFTRSLRLESRLLKAYLARLALLGVTFFALLTSQSYSRFLGAPGLQFFRSIVFIDFFFVSLAATSYFSSVIAEEKEEMTLGLLRMTSLSPISILLGKSTSRLLGAGMILLAQFPFILLAITLGGVGMAQIVAAYATLLAYMVFVCNLALFCSIVCRRSKNAGGLTGLLLIIFFVAPPFFLFLLPAMRAAVPAWITAFFQWMLEASAFSRLIEIIATGFTGPVAGFQVISNLVMGAVLFLISWKAFDFFTREQKQAAPARGLVFRRTSAFRRFGAGRAWAHPLIWKDFFFISGGVFGIILRFVTYGVVLAIVAYLFSRAWGPGFRRAFDFEAYGTTVMVIALIGLFIEMCYFASRMFKEEIKWKTLPAIAMLPIPTYKLAYHKALGCLIALIPAATYFIIGAFIAPKRFDDIIVGVAYSLPGAIFFLYLVVFFSLLVKRGALALAFLVGYVASNFLIMSIFMMVRGEMGAGLVISYTILAGIIIALHFGIGKLLRRAAAQ